MLSTDNDAGLIDFDGDKLKWTANGKSATVAEVEARYARTPY